MINTIEWIRANSLVLGLRLVLTLALTAVGIAAAVPAFGQSSNQDSENAKYEMKLIGLFDSDALAADAEVPSAGVFLV